MVFERHYGEVESATFYQMVFETYSVMEKLNKNE